MPDVGTRGLAAETSSDGIVVFRQTGAIQNPGQMSCWKSSCTKSGTRPLYYVVDPSPRGPVEL